MNHWRFLFSHTVVKRASRVRTGTTVKCYRCYSDQKLTAQFIGFCGCCLLDQLTEKREKTQSRKNVQHLKGN